MNYKLVHIKQGNFYYKDEDNVNNVLRMDRDPFSFEVGNATIPIDIQYGSKRVCVVVDSLCTISMLKARFSAVAVCGSDSLLDHAARECDDERCVCPIQRSGL